MSGELDGPIVRIEVAPNSDVIVHKGIIFPARVLFLSERGAKGDFLFWVNAQTLNCTQSFQIALLDQGKQFSPVRISRA